MTAVYAEIPGVCGWNRKRVLGVLGDQTTGTASDTGIAIDTQGLINLDDRIQPVGGLRVTAA